MTRQGAERAVIVSALVVIGAYSYRLLTEGHTSPSGKAGGPAQLIGVGAPPNIGRFITGWGFAFFVIAIIAEAAPSLGGSLAILVATSDVLGNAAQVTADVNSKLGQGKIAGAKQAQAMLPKNLQQLVPTTTGQLEQIPPLVQGTVPGGH